jgi:ABC-type amino acid transport substrate-binding protein
MLTRNRGRAMAQAADTLIARQDYTAALALLDSGRAGAAAAPDYLLLALAARQPVTAPRWLVRVRDKMVGRPSR